MTNLTTQDVAHLEFKSAVLFPEAIQTINQLVELVAEMRNTIKYLEPSLFENGSGFTLERAAAQKANALLSGLKEDTK
jgi:hypothetical protein